MWSFICVHCRFSAENKNVGYDHYLIFLHNQVVFWKENLAYNLLNHCQLVLNFCPIVFL